MNRANYTGRVQRNFPLTTDGLDFVQQQIMMAAEYARSAGGNYILSGCTTNGSNVSAGTVIVNGEILPFSAGVKQNTIRIVETKESVTAGSETYDDAYVYRRAEFGANIGNIETYLWDSLHAFPTNKFLLENSATKTELDNLRNQIMPKGFIGMWSGDVSSMPAGFVLCDGGYSESFGNNVPDLRGRFIVGYYRKRENEQVANSELQGDYGAIKSVGGVKDVTLTINQIPEHDHNMPGSSADNGDPGSLFVTSYFDQNNGGKTQKSGGGGPHENRPPYYVLAYIIKVV